jgi:FKBP-type peptidyl-prolyl cis-trans isomerase FkpA
LSLLCVVFGVAACGQPDQPETTAVADAPADSIEETKLVTELIIDNIQEGDGAEAAAGANAVVHYTGWLYDPEADANRGSKFDSSVDRNQPFRFALGAGQVIKGWDQGVVGMKIGGKRVLTIPPDLGYGSAGAGGVIPPDATLVFEVELIDLQ